MPCGDSSKPTDPTIRPKTRHGHDGHRKAGIWSPTDHRTRRAATADRNSSNRSRSNIKDGFGVWPHRIISTGSKLITRQASRHTVVPLCPPRTHSGLTERSHFRSGGSRPYQCLLYAAGHRRHRSCTGRRHQCRCSGDSRGVCPACRTHASRTTAPTARDNSSGIARDTVHIS